jgi:hypothetical protein
MKDDTLLSTAGRRVNPLEQLRQAEKNMKASPISRKTRGSSSSERDTRTSSGTTKPQRLDEKLVAETLVNYFIFNLYTYCDITGGEEAFTTTRPLPSWSDLWTTNGTIAHD